MRKLLALFPLLLCAAFTTPAALAAPAAKTFELAHGADNATARIVEVSQSSKETRITVVYRSVNEIANVGIYPAGHANAFVLKDAQTGKLYPLKSSEGIALRPDDSQDLQPGEDLVFQLVFAGTKFKRFHLFEANPEERDDEVFWQFSDVILD